MTSMMTFLVLLLAPSQVDVTTLDGQSASGAIVSWTGDEIVIGESSFEAANVQRIGFADAASLDDAPNVIELISGTTVAATQITRSADVTTIQFRDQSYDIPTRRVAAIRFAFIDEQTRDTWRELLERERRDDLFALVRGESLDYVGCVVGDIAEETVSLRFSNRNGVVPKAKLFGLLFANRKPATDRIAGRVTLIDGSQLAAESLSWSDDQLALKVADGFELSVPATDLASVDLAAGRVTMLRDIEPRSVSYSPFGDNYDEYAWQLRTDQNALGDPIRLGGKPHATGYWVHSGTTAAFVLPPRTKRFQATLGIDELKTPGAPVRVELLADGRSVFDTVVQPEAPESVDVDLTDVRQLTVVASTMKPDGHGIREHLVIIGGRLIQE